MIIYNVIKSITNHQGHLLTKIRAVHTLFKAILFANVCNYVVEGGGKNKANIKLTYLITAF